MEYFYNVKQSLWIHSRDSLKEVEITDILPSFSIEIEKGIYLSVSIFLFDSRSIVF